MIHTNHVFISFLSQWDAKENMTELSICMLRLQECGRTAAQWLAHYVPCKAYSYRIFHRNSQQKKTWHKAHLIGNPTAVVAMWDCTVSCSNIKHRLWSNHTKLILISFSLQWLAQAWHNIHFASWNLTSDFASHWEFCSGCGAGLHIDLHITQQWLVCSMQSIFLSYFDNNGY
jgi:hypothetical protein